jgi:membrane-anchored protein YejM (alkaline phosphatase superfamily)
MMNSSWLQYKFLEDVTEFFSWQAYGQREMSKQWDKIKKRTESGAESDYKLAIIDADDLLAEVLDNRGYDGENIEESIKKAGKLIAPILDSLLKAHEIRNSIVYNPDFKLSVQEAKKVLDTYESAVNNIGMG